MLDVACGPGVVARLAARHAGAGQVTGLDINPGMVQLARSLPSELRISWQEGSALQMPFPDESFDVVLCQQGVQFFPDRLLACARCGASWRAPAGPPKAEAERRRRPASRAARRVI